MKQHTEGNKDAKFEAGKKYIVFDVMYREKGEIEILKRTPTTVTFYNSVFEKNDRKKIVKSEDGEMINILWIGCFAADEK